jgi:hypothetical protein
MCDYSLEHIASRPAAVGDKLVTTRFSGSLTRGFAAINEPRVAVCLLPGTEIAFEHDVERVSPLGFLQKRTLDQKVARFRLFNQGRPGAHRDALEFPGGETVLLTYLVEGQHATVLQLPVAAGTTSAVKEQESASNSSLVSAAP